MTDRRNRLDDLSGMDKHLSSKLYQKFIQKETHKPSDPPLSSNLSKPALNSTNFDSDESSFPSSIPPQKPVEKLLPPARSVKTLKSAPISSDPDPFDPSFSPSNIDYNPHGAISKQRSFQETAPDERPVRSRWQDLDSNPDLYQRRDSELKGFSDYIPPENFIDYDEPPDFYARPPAAAPQLRASKSSDLESQLQSKDAEIRSLKADLASLEARLSKAEDSERRLKNLRTERDMIDRKAKVFEDENTELKRRIDSIEEEIEDIKYEAEGKVKDMEKEIRGWKKRVKDLENELRESKEREKNYANKSRRIERVEEDEDKWEDRYDDYDYNRHRNEEIRKPKVRQQEDYQNEYTFARQNKPTKDPTYDRSSYPERSQDKPSTDPYSHIRYEKPTPSQLSEKPAFDRSSQLLYHKNPSEISSEVKARIGATNSSSVSSVLNWGSKPLKSEEILSLENKILSLQSSKKQFEDELSKIPEHAKKIAVLRRRDELEQELSSISSTISALKLKVKTLQSSNLN